jgi:hypothetical protein
MCFEPFGIATSIFDVARPPGPHALWFFNLSDFRRIAASFKYVPQSKWLLASQLFHNSLRNKRVTFLMSVMSGFLLNMSGDILEVERSSHHRMVWSKMK